MSVAWAVAMACAASGGAMLTVAVPVVVAVSAVVVAVAVGSRALVVGCIFVLAGSLSHDAWAAIDAPFPEELDGSGSVVRDPQRMNGSVRAEVSFDGRRYQVWASSGEGEDLLQCASGDEVQLSGRTSDLSGLATPSLRRRHVVARVEATSVQCVGNESVLNATANNVRAVVEKGSWSLPENVRPLYLGLALGDDREQSEDQREAFRDSGLAHLLAVSGQNVAFLLLLLQPLVRRFDLTGRVCISLGALILFGTVTRWEPSVVRAVVMASVVLGATWMGRRISSWRTLALAATLCMLIDPLLVGSIGFLLSITACIGMAALGAPIASRVPGPKWFRTAVGFTVAAQIGVAPVQMTVFGDLPAVAVLTNVAAGPLAAGVMMWAMTGGIAAGLLGDPAAGLLHWPTAQLLDALNWVAYEGANAPIGNWSVTAVCFLGAVLMLLPRRHGSDAEPSKVGLGSGIEPGRLLDKGRRPDVGRPAAQLARRNSFGSGR
jgi:competence protein ComEC